MTARSRGLNALNNIFPMRPSFPLNPLGVPPANSTRPLSLEKNGGRGQSARNDPPFVASRASNISLGNSIIASTAFTSSPSVSRRISRKKVSPVVTVPFEGKEKNTAAFASDQKGKTKIPHVKRGRCVKRENWNP